MTSLTEQVLRMPSEAREAALETLDHVSRPLTKREIEHALKGRGVLRSQRAIIAAALAPLHIIALVGPETGDEHD